MWFAWKFLSLWYQTQQKVPTILKDLSCDLLENFYLCGIKHNRSYLVCLSILVVICLKISIFVVSNTTCVLLFSYLLLLWFAWKFLSLWYQTQRLIECKNREDVVICLKISIFVVSNTTYQGGLWLLLCCDLLENFYLCGIKHNKYWCCSGTR